MGTCNDVELDDLEVAGSRLLLRRWEPDDAQRVLDVMQDRSMYEFLVLPDPYTPDAAAEFVTSLGHEGRDEGTGIGCAVVDRESGRVVGSAALRIGCSGSDNSAGTAELGYWIAPDSRGRGYGAEACRVLAHLGFEQLGLARISIECDVRNQASMRTALAAGFGFEGVARGAAPVAGRGAGDLARFGRLSDDPPDPIPPSFPPLPPGGLDDGVIALRVLEPGDAAELAETEDEVTISVGFGGRVRTARDHAVAAERAGLHWLVGTAAVVAIVDDATGGLAGSVTLRKAGPPGVGGIGYVVHPLFRGRGYTARALRLLAPWALANGFTRLELGAKVENVASQRAALAADFEADGVRLRRLRNVDGSFSDEARFALLASRIGDTIVAAGPDPDPAAQPE